MAEAPLTNCRNVGRKVIEPIIAKPTMKLRIEAMVNTRPRNSRIGRIGSSARISTSTKIARQISEPPNRPMMVADPHGVLGAAPGGGQDQSAGAQPDEQHAEVVDLRLAGAPAWPGMVRAAMMMTTMAIGTLT